MKQLNLKNVKLTNNGKQIDVDVKLEIPKTLYKFYALNDYNIKGVENGTIFFSPNNLLNDILEGNFELLWDFENLLKNEKVDTNFRAQLISGINKSKIDFLSWRGIFSMSDDYKNELLWIHYTNEAGFCFEFDVEKLKNFFKVNNGVNHSYFFPISYNDPITKIDFNKYSKFSQINNKQEIDALLPLMYSLAVKEAHWKYEKEWRLLINHQKFNYISDPNHILSDESKKDENNKTIGNVLEIDRDIITKVILAPRFFNNNRFNKHELLDRDIEIFDFKDHREGQNAYKLMKNLHKHYSSSIYQINKVANKSFIEREINTKIEIIDISQHYLKIKKTILNETIL